MEWYRLWAISCRRFNLKARPLEKKSYLRAKSHYLLSSKQKVPPHSVGLFLARFKVEAGHDLRGDAEQNFLNESSVWKDLCVKYDRKL